MSGTKLRVALVLALLLGALVADAAELQSLVVVLVVNGESQGEHFVLRDAQGGFLLNADEVDPIAALAAGIESELIDGERFVRLDDLPRARVEFDEPTLTLSLTLPPDAFAAQAYSLRREQRRPSAATSGVSGLFNYRLGYSAADEGAALLSLATEQAVRADRWLGRNQALFQRVGGATRTLRYETQVVREDTATMQRLTFGDAFTHSGELGRAVPIGGVSWSSAFELSPYFVRQPSLNFAGAVELPSEVQMYVGGTRVFQRSVQPGPFEIADLDYHGGLQDVVVVIRDALGHERVIDSAFYFSDQVLARGLHDFSYQIGRLREDFGTRSADYGEAAWSAHHRYGLTDQLTIGFNGEGTGDYGNVGPALVYRDNRLGVLALAAAGSWSASGRSGAAWSASYSYNAEGFLAAAGLRGHTHDYSNLHVERVPQPPPSDLTLSLGYSGPIAGSFNVGYAKRAYGRADRSILSLGYTRRLFRNLSLVLGYRNVHGHDEGAVPVDGGEWSVSLFYLPGSGQSAGAAWQRDSRGRQSEALQFGSAPPGQLGGSYRLAATRTSDIDGITTTTVPSMAYNGRRSTLDAEVFHASGATDATRYTASVAGSVAVVGDYVGLSRPITDSFAVARIDPPLQGVRVYQSNRDIGRTDAGGRLLVPELTANVNNQVAIEPADIPIEYSIEQASQTLAPGTRGGVLADFHVDRLQAVAGTIRYRMNGQWRPLDNRRVRLEGGPGFATGRGGRFYVENLAAGVYRATAQTPSGECLAVLDVPDARSAVIELDAPVACEPAPLRGLIRSMRLSPTLSGGRH